MYKTLGTYTCLQCGHENYDDFRKIRNYLEKVGSAPAIVISRNTGVSLKTIERFWMDEFEEKFANLSCVKVEIEEGSEDSGTEAILVCKKENVILKTILREVLIPEKIAEIQKLVMENKKIPKY